NFDSTWDKGSLIGLLLHASEKRGYEFLVRIPENRPNAPAGSALPTASSIAEARKSGGQLSLQIRRHGRLLRERLIRAEIVGGGPLQFEASLDRGRLTLRLNGMRELELQTWAVTGVEPSGETGVFGLYWPAGVGLERLRAFCQTKPINPSPLERGDVLYELD